MYIILEYFLLENFIINFFILYITKMITKTKVKAKNIIFGAIFASLYSLVLFYPPLLFLTRSYMKVIASILIVGLTYRTRDIKLLFYEILGFYMVSFIFGGFTIGISYASMNIFELFKFDSHGIGQFKVKFLIYGVLSSVFVSYKLFNYHNKKLLKSSQILKVKVYYKEKEVIINSLVDTGNALVEPFTNRPVMIAEYNSLKSIFPEQVQDLINSHDNKDFMNFERILRDLKEEILVRFIPFRTIGNENGTIIGFKPNYIAINIEGENIVREDFIIGIYNGELSRDREFDGLLHYEILDRGI